MASRNSGSEASLYWKSDPRLDAPDLLFCQVEFPVPSERTAARGVPEHGWTMFAGLARPASRGQVRLTGAQCSGILSSMTEANCIVVLHHDQANVAAGQMVDVLLFDGLV